MSNIRIRSIRIAATAAAGLLLAATAPAHATENGSNSAASSVAAARTAASKTIQTRSATDPFQEVCVRGYQTSGTLVRRQICQTRQAWERVGGVPN